MSAANPIGTLTARPQPVYRGGPSNPPPPNQFAIQSATATYSWGAEPGEATIIYDPASVLPVTAGFYVTLEIAGHTFSGMCLADTPETSSGGARRVLKFQDNRYWLKKDQVYCAFNRLDDHIVNNVRVKRYVHYLPDLAHNVVLTPAPFQFYPNTSTPSIITSFRSGPYFGGLIKTYTDSPLTSAQIIILILNSAYVRDTWTVSFQPDMFTNAVWDIDATGGKSLAALLQEISDQQGLLFTNTPTFNLVWIRKGFLDGRWPSPLPLLPAPETNPSTGEQQVLIDDLAQGIAISENPTNIMILGDRNVYMPLNIPMVPDWSPGWEQFWDINLFRQDIYQRGVVQASVTIGGVQFAAGTKFTAIGGSQQDPEQLIARQLALVYSLEISVAQYAQLHGEALFVDEPNFADYRLFAGKTRLDMPAALYIDQVLFRAFRFPDGFTVTNQNGLEIPLDSLEIIDKMIARVTYDPISGDMSANPNLSADGNGLAIVQGYQVGQGLFEQLNPDRFNIQNWTDSQSVWQAVQFQIDDSGQPNGKFILFANPIISSKSLVSLINGYAVFTSNPTKSDGVTRGFDIPPVQCTVCFAAEKFMFFETGAINAGATETYGVGGLNRELVFTYGEPGYVEVPYSDGLLASQKAANFIAPLLLNQYTYFKGGYKHALMPDAKGNYPRAIGLTPIHDRITVELSPSGVSERIEYTTEYPRTVYTPERDLDRNVKLKTLLPGQDALRREAVTAKLVASALQTSAAVRKTMADAFRGFFGSDEALYPTNNLGSGLTPGNVTLPAGTPLWSLPGANSGATERTNTTSVPPKQTTAQHTTFVGSTTRDKETGGAGQVVYVQRSGTIYVRVMGPCQTGDPVGQVVGQDYLSASAGGNFVGTAQEAISTATVQLIRVETGSTVPTVATFPFQIQKVSETQVQINPQSALLDGLNITDAVDIFGLATPFTVQAGTLIYLEVLFDLNGNSIFANIGTTYPTTSPEPNSVSRVSWRTEEIPGGFTSASGFPSLVGTIDGTNLPNEKTLFGYEAQYWVDADIGDKHFQEALTDLNLFTPSPSRARYNQFYAYALIGFCSTSPGAQGITLNGAGTGTSFTIVQCVETHLMLQGFCSGGVPSQVPVPYSGPFIQDLPTPTILGTPGAGEIVTIKMPPANSSATIFYSLDGAAYVQYANPFTVLVQGTHTVKAYATQQGFFDSSTVTAQFTV